MTYCVGVLLQEGLIFASDSRTHAGVDDFATFCKMTVFEEPGERVLVMLSSGNLAGTQAVVSLLKQRSDAGGTSILNAATMFDVATLVADAMRDVDNRDGAYLAGSDIKFDASFILGGQIRGEPCRLFRIYAEGNFIEAGADTFYFQTGETKYGKPLLQRVLRTNTSIDDAAKCVLVSFDSTMRSNLSVGMPIDLVCYQRGSLLVARRRRFGHGDPYFTALHDEWSRRTLTMFAELPGLEWRDSTVAVQLPVKRARADRAQKDRAAKSRAPR
jgi:putative proteasome-type protease